MTPDAMLAALQRSHPKARRSALSAPTLLFVLLTVLLAPAQAGPFEPSTRPLDAPLRTHLLLAGDFDCDGDPDLIASAQAAEGDAYFLRNDGGFTFASPRNLLSAQP